MNTALVLAQVSNERARQEAKWGEQNHTPADWFLILMEEVGEAAKAATEARAAERQGLSTGEWWQEYCKELIETAAVAVAMVESFYRNDPPQKE